MSGLCNLVWCLQVRLEPERSTFQVLHSLVGSWSYPHSARLERLSRDKHSSLSGAFVNYVSKKFHNIGTLPVINHWMGSSLTGFWINPWAKKTLLPWWQAYKTFQSSLVYIGKVCWVKTSAISRHDYATPICRGFFGCMTQVGSFLIVSCNQRSHSKWGWHNHIAISLIFSPKADILVVQSCQCFC